jgi:hypothetical protein
MKIEDISPETEPLYFCCLEDWSEEMKEAGDHKATLVRPDEGQGGQGEAGKERE